jgi:hypothetical protein
MSARYITFRTHFEGALAMMVRRISADTCNCTARLRRLLDISTALAKDQEWQGVRTMMK